MWHDSVDLLCAFSANKRFQISARNLTRPRPLAQLASPARGAVCPLNPLSGLPNARPPRHPALSSDMNCRMWVPWLTCFSRRRQGQHLTLIAMFAAQKISARLRTTALKHNNVGNGLR